MQAVWACGTAPPSEHRGSGFAGPRLCLLEGRWRCALHLLTWAGPPVVYRAGRRTQRTRLTPS